MSSTELLDLERRVRETPGAWSVTVDRRIDTDSSVLLFGQRHHQHVVLKVVRRPGDEWVSGAVVSAFGGRGVVRALEHVDGAVLLEQLMPGNSLADLPRRGDDDQATAILADVIGRMSPDSAPRNTPTVEAWGLGFRRYVETRDRQIPSALLEAAGGVYERLCATQSSRHLLHGDLHHYNVLFDADRGWLAIDPKGVVGELEYEVGAALRNPYGQPTLFTAPDIIRRRAERFAAALSMDVPRLLGWAFAQAVLAAVWLVEDGVTIGRDNAWLALASQLRPMLNGTVDA